MILLLMALHFPQDCDKLKLEDLVPPECQNISKQSVNRNDILNLPPKSDTYDHPISQNRISQDGIIQIKEHPNFKAFGKELDHIQLDFDGNTPAPLVEVGIFTGESDGDYDMHRNKMIKPCGGLGSSYKACFDKAWALSKEAHAKAESCWSNECIAEIWDKAYGQMSQIGTEMGVAQDRMIDELTRKMTQGWAEDERRERQNAVVKRVPTMDMPINSAPAAQVNNRHAEIVAKNREAAAGVESSYGPRICGGPPTLGGANDNLSCYEVVDNLVYSAEETCNNSNNEVCHRVWDEMIATLKGRVQEKNSETNLGNITPATPRRRPSETKSYFDHNPSANVPKSWNPDGR